MSSPFYPMEALKRPNVPVRLYWSGRYFAAIMRFEGGRKVYFTLDEKGAVDKRLPLARDRTTAGEVRSTMADEPNSWQPLDLAQWPEELPAPPSHWKVAEGVMLSRGRPSPSPERLNGSGKLHAMAQQAEEAARIKAQVEAQFADGGDYSAPRKDRDSQEAIEDRRPRLRLGFRQMVLRADVRRRVLTAMRTLSSTRHPDARLVVALKGLNISWPSDAMPSASAEPREHQPRPEDLADELTALGWLNAPSPIYPNGLQSLRDGNTGAGMRGRCSDWDVVNLVAHRWSFERIGERITGEHDVKVLRRFERTIDHCWWAANQEAQGRIRRG